MKIKCFHTHVCIKGNGSYNLCIILYIIRKKNQDHTVDELTILWFGVSHTNILPYIGSYQVVVRGCYATKTSWLTLRCSSAIVDYVTNAS